MPTSRLGPHQRAAALQALRETELDILVIGGGVVGTGSALDAAARGLRAGLVEARDFAIGTSSRSSKLIHGGLRYLEQRNFGLVKEALEERALLLRDLCPYLVHPVPFLYPLKHRGWERLYVGLGVLLYDTLGLGAGTRGVPAHRHLTRTGALRLAPALRDDALVGAIRYYDAQVDDARHTMVLARTAAFHGAHVVTQAPVVGLLKDGERVVGARARDRLSGEEFEIRAQRVINATGPWTDHLQELAGPPAVEVRPSKGIHFLVPRAAMDLRVGLILRTEKSVLFVIPWKDHWIIGTTDTDWTESRDIPTATRADIDYLLERVNAVLRRPLGYGDIEGVYAGLRPLLSAPSGSTTELSREHTVTESAPGLVTIAGGKYTTYRVMARDAVDAAVRALDRAVPASITHRLPLLGTPSWAARHNQRVRLASESGLDVAWIDHLLGRYGDLIDDLLGLIAERPDLGQPLAGAGGYLRAEAVYAASHEGALHLDDVLARRTRAMIEQRDRALSAAGPVAELVGEVLGWDDEQRKREVAAFEAQVAAEQRAEQERSDEAAVRVRTEVLAGAPTV